MTPTDAARELLGDCHLSGFTFSTGFSLRFEKRRGGAVVFVTLDGAWSFGTPAAWAALVATWPFTGVEPEEPVRAAMLAQLRWSMDHSVRDVLVEGNNLRIEFGCGEALVTRVGTISGGGSEWDIFDEKGRSVTFEDEEVTLTGFAEGSG
ncbi:hypothetical protein L6R49_29220 [Myxococcota bacterium]|nr:hypothetical protein [Myxococcota bacterium]